MAKIRIDRGQIDGAYERAQQGIAHSNALKTERADELDKLNVPSASRQAAAAAANVSPRAALGLGTSGTFQDFQRRQMERDALAALASAPLTQPAARTGSERSFEPGVGAGTDYAARQRNANAAEIKPAARAGKGSGSRHTAQNRKYAGVDRAAMAQAQRDAFANSTLANMGKSIGYSTASGVSELAGLAADYNNRIGYTPSEHMRERYIERGWETRAPEYEQAAAQGYYDLSDALYQNAKLAQEEAKRNKGAVGGFLVDAGTTIGSLAGRAALDAAVPGLGTAALMADVAGGAARSYRQNAGEEYNPDKAALLAAAGAGGVALGGALSKGVNNAAISGLTKLGLQNNVPLNIGAGALSGLGYFAGEAALNEPAKYLADNSYRPDAGELASRAAGAALFGAVSRAVNIAATSQTAKDALTEQAEELTRRYMLVKTRLNDASVSAEERAALCRGPGLRRVI